MERDFAIKTVIVNQIRVATFSLFGCWLILSVSPLWLWNIKVSQGRGTMQRLQDLKLGTHGFFHGDDLQPLKPLKIL